MRRLLAAVLGVVVCNACGGGGSAPSAVARSTPSPVPTATGTAPAANIIDPPTGSIYLGAFVNTSGTAVAQPSDMTAFEALVGRKMVLTQHYYGFDDTFPTGSEAFDLSEGRIPIESWGCGMPNAQVAAGAADAAIAARAQALRKFGAPVFVRYMWEMNTPSTATYRPQCYDPATDLPDGVFSPTEFIAAWRHIHAIFLAQGAANVIWLWNPAGQPVGTAYYPGNDVVDWVGMDRYDYGTASFPTTYAASYAPLAAIGKPMMIAETGALAAQQPSFFPGAAATLQAQFPLVHAYVYFDADATNDWLLAGGGVAAFAAFANDPYLSAKPPI